MSHFWVGEAWYHREVKKNDSDIKQICLRFNRGTEIWVSQIMVLFQGSDAASCWTTTRATELSDCSRVSVNMFDFQLL